MKTAYDTFTAEYAALLAQETSGDIVEGTPEFDTLLEMEGQLPEKKEEYTNAKTMLDAAIRERNDKAWNRAYAELMEA